MKTLHSVFITCLVSLLLIGCMDQTNKVTRNEEAGRKFVKYWSEHDDDRFLSLLADECLYEDVCSGRTYRDRQSFIH